MIKKITFLFAFIGMIIVQSCTVNEVVEDPIDNDTISEVYETNLLAFTSSNDFSQTFFFPRPIFASDMVLVYRLSGTFQGQDVWKLQPENYYFPDGTLDYGYNFDFTRNDVGIFMIGNDLATVPSQFRINQIFRIVVIPAFLNKSSANKNNIDFKDYKAVIKAFNINESNIKKIKN